MNFEIKGNTERLLKLVILTAAVITGIFLFYRLCFFLAPFIIAFGLSSLMEPLIRLSVKRLGVSRKIAAPVIILVMLSIIGLLLFLLVSNIINELIGMSAILPQFFTELYKNTTALMLNISDWLPPEITEYVGGIISSLSAGITGIVNSAVKGALSTAKSLPEVLIFIIVTLMSTYFLASDRDRIYGYFRVQLPESWIIKATSIKKDMFSALFGYIKAQLILMSITFTELFLGFSIIRVRYALLFALLVAIIDAIPILGTGTVLIPWGIYSIVTGDIRQGVSVLIIYIIILVVRQMIEPKILSHQIGVYPLLTLLAMYTGLRLMGFVGLILGPVTVLLLKNIFSGIMKKRTFKEMIGESGKRV